MKNTTLFTNLTLIDGIADTPMENAALLVENDKIAFAGNLHQSKVPQDIPAIDCSGSFVIPGLIDCHIHCDLHGFADTFKENLVEDKVVYKNDVLGITVLLTKDINRHCINIDTGLVCASLIL